MKCSQEAILNFLRQRGGRVPNTELVEHFKSIFPSDPKKKAAVRELFKGYVDSVAYVKTENGVKHVCLKKKFREDTLNQEKSQREDSGQVSGRDVTRAGHASGMQTSSRLNHAQVPHVLETLRNDTRAQNHCNASEVEEDDSCDAMGNKESVKRENRDSKREDKVEIPVITLSQPSPQPVQEPVFVLPELDDGTPKSSREHFLEVMMCSSPQVRLNIDLRRLSRSDSDSASISSCNLEEDRNSATLDPLEHEWMMCASDAEWGSLQRLLNDDPGLVLKKDFVTGFTCLHWAAKQGKPELIALIINFAKQHNVPVSVDVRSSTGYTPLHLAAMHSHMDVVKLLVGAYNADVEVRDYSGRKACQYLTDNVSVDIRDIIGAYEIETENKPASAGKRWRFNKVLQVKPLRRLNSTGDSDTLDGGAREAPLRRRSSLSRMKPKLQKLKWRTSQLVHSSTFHGAEDLEKRKARPKTHYFG
ncbi:hypothetical protein NQD34_001202 [Periophthalmus magnuspinnatus]|nr:hypothetical protein NQD34_001202 [Periophthalmus magnuspinnatus]